jgi:hypothetical protein
MKRISVFSLIVFIFLSGSQLSAQDYRMALGIRLSSSDATLGNSITGKYFITDRTAIEGIVSFGNRFGVGGLLEIHRPFDVPGFKWFYGGGLYVGNGDYEETDNATYFGPAGIIGLDYKFQDIPLNLSLDFKPELDILPAITAHYAVAFSVRFTIK